MTVVAMDTHAVVKELVAAGFTDEQAEAVTRVVRKAQDVDFSDLATRSDLSTTKGDLEKNLAVIKADLEKSIAETKAEILKWMVGSIGIQTVVIIGAVVALTRSVPH
jgi:hypothetical protein